MTMHQLHQFDCILQKGETNWSINQLAHGTLVSNLRPSQSSHKYLSFNTIEVTTTPQKHTHTRFSEIVGHQQSKPIKKELVWSRAMSLRFCALALKVSAYFEWFTVINQIHSVKVLKYCTVPSASTAHLSLRVNSNWFYCFGWLPKKEAFSKNCLAKLCLIGDK